LTLFEAFATGYSYTKCASHIWGLGIVVLWRSYPLWLTLKKNDSYSALLH